MKLILSLAILIGFSTIAKAQVGVGTAAPDSSSILDLNSTNKGVLIPRLSTAEIAAISSPAEGLLVFDTTKKLFYYYANSAWLTLNPWNTEYGTTSNMTTYTSGQTGNIGIGVGSPAEKLDVNGTVKMKGLRFNEAPDLDALAAVEGQSNGNYLSFSDGSVAGYQGFDDNTFYFSKSPGETTSVNMQVEGNVTATQFVGNGTIPIGGIIMWSGSLTAIPAGWALCDGQTVSGVATPDLRERFIVGAASSDNSSVSGGAYAVGNTGGQNSVTLTVAQMPEHNHGVNDPGHSHQYVDRYSNDEISDNADDRWVGDNDDTYETKSTAAAATNISIQNNGGGGAHENRPPYYALAFIIRVQ